MARGARRKNKLLKLITERAFQLGDPDEKGSFVFDLKSIAFKHEGLVALSEVLIDFLKDDFPNVEAVGCFRSDGDFLVAGVVACSKSCAGFVIRRDPEAFGTGRYIEGFGNLYDGMPVCILTETIGSGNTQLMAAMRAQEFGLNVQGILGIIDKKGDGREKIERRGFKIKTIFTLEDFGKL